MVANVTGMVLKVYQADSRDREGNPVIESRMDIYDGDELLKIRKIPRDTFCQGEQVSLKVRVYGNEYGVSCVYVSTIGSAVVTSPRK